VLLVHGRDIIKPVEVRQSLQIGLGFDQLFDPAMEQADVRVDPNDNFSVQFDHEPKHAMRRRMLRPKVDREIPHRGVGHDKPPEGTKVWQ
jgi:hypothetical protein